MSPALVRITGVVVPTAAGVVAATVVVTAVVKATRLVANEDINQTGCSESYCRQLHMPLLTHHKPG